MGVSSDIEFIIQYNYKWWHDILNIPLNEKINCDNREKLKLKKIKRCYKICICYVLNAALKQNSTHRLCLLRNNNTSEKIYYQIVKGLPKNKL